MIDVTDRWRQVEVEYVAEGGGHAGYAPPPEALPHVNAIRAHLVDSSDPDSDPNGGEITPDQQFRDALVASLCHVHGP